MDPTVKVKTEITSPKEDKFSGKLDAIDKWRARVLYEQDSANLAKRIERQVAVLKVSCPFLTERQILGKAWKSCGLNSVMGCIPRYGISPQIKKEFRRYRKFSNRNLSQRPSIKREIKIEKDDKPLICPYTFESPTESAKSEKMNNLDAKSLEKKRLYSSLNEMTLPYSDKTTQMSKKTSSSTIQSMIASTSNTFVGQEEIIIKNKAKPSTLETPSFDTNVSYYRQTLYEFMRPHNLNRSSLNTESINSSIQPQMLQCIPSIESDSSKTISDLDKKIETLKSTEMINTFSYNSKNTLSNSVIVHNPFYNEESQEDVEIDSSNNCIIISDKNQNEEICYLSPPKKVSKVSKQWESIQNITNTKFSKNAIAEIQSVELHSPNESSSSKIDYKLNENHSSHDVTPVRNASIDARKRIYFDAIAEECDSHLNSDEKNSIPINENQQKQSVLEIQSPDLFVTPPNNAGLLISLQQKNILPKKLCNISESSKSSESFDLYLPSTSKNNLSEFENQESFASMQQKISLSENLEKSEDNVNYVTESINYNFFENCFPKFTLSLPLTSEDSALLSYPSDLLLSNFCSEYDKSYTKANLKPNPYKNYYTEKINQSLKQEYDKIIPMDTCYIEFFKAPNKSFKSVKNHISKKITNILLILDDSN